MRVSKVIYKENNDVNKALAVCDIVFDGVFRCCNVCLYKGGEKGYYLVFPSKQDIYQSIKHYNGGLDFKEPPDQFSSKNKGKTREEYFFPTNSDFYHEILNEVILGYEKGLSWYIPD